MPSQSTQPVVQNTVPLAPSSQAPAYTSSSSVPMGQGYYNFNNVVPTQPR
jgi:hypothetical protein